MPAALIVGAYGQDNPGDEALLDAVVQVVRDRGWTPVVSTARPGETAARLDLHTVPATGPAAVSAGARADALVVGGGTIFKELHPSSGRPAGSLLRRTAALAGAFKARRRPVAMVGVGAAPISRPRLRRLAAALAAQADLLVVRDVESADLLVGMGTPPPVRVGADLSWLVLDRAPVPAAPPSPSIGVAISHLAGDDDLFGRVAGALRAVGARGLRIELEPWQGSPRLGADARLAARLADAVGPVAAVIRPPDDLAEATGRMLARRAALAMRFHATVAAAGAGTPFVALAHEPKLLAMARAVGQPAIAVDASAEELATALRLAATGPRPRPEAVEEQRRRALASAELLALLLAGSGPTERLADLQLVPEPAPA